MISVLAIIVPLVAALVAALARAAIRQQWNVQEIFADFAFAFIILITPVLFKA